MDPLTLLKRDENRVEPFLSKYWVPFSASAIGVLAACIANFGTRRPVFSGIQKHTAFGAIGWVLGTYAEDYRAGYLAEKDAVLRHYVELHPEDFPTPERKKFKEVIEPWIPIR